MRGGKCPENLSDHVLRARSITVSKRSPLLPFDDCGCLGREMINDLQTSFRERAYGTIVGREHSQDSSRLAHDRRGLDGTNTGIEEDFKTVDGAKNGSVRHVGDDYTACGLQGRAAGRLAGMHRVEKVEKRAAKPVLHENDQASGFRVIKLDIPHVRLSPFY